MVTADPRQQATEALRIVAQAGISPEQLALGSADAETGDELARAFTRHGWIAYHPATTLPPGSLVRWLRVWSKWLGDPTLATLQDLLSLPETGKFVFSRHWLARSLAKQRNQWMAIRPDDLHRRFRAAEFRTEDEKNAVQKVLEAAQILEKWRKSCLERDFIPSLVNLIGEISSSKQAEEICAWLEEVEPTARRMGRPVQFWIELMLSDLPAPIPLPPPGRMIDVQGWLEIFHEPGEHLILCGMNEGKVPARSGGEPWLSETSRGFLGLIQEKKRGARDAYLFHAMVQARQQTGSVHAFCGKAGGGGEALLPSRLLLAAEPAELPRRVQALFREIEPPEAGLRWEADWLWQPPTPTEKDVPTRLSVTSLRDYLACPFRYYLKHVLKMQQPEANRNEWNARDFGTVIHEVLERWARDTEAREFEKTEALHAWLSAELDRVVEAWFGRRPPLAVRIQTEAMRQRLLWSSRIQACEKASGWEVVEIEREVIIPAGNASLVAKIDRIDRHRDTGEYRVLDYKTGKVDGVDKAHRRKMTARTVLPAHLPEDCPAIYEGEEKGKAAKFRWINLQLPLYAVAWMAEKKELATPCYWALGATENEVAIQRWENFSPLELEAANECALWIAEKIAKFIFMPPVERVTYDDFKILGAGRDLAEMVTPIN